ncbi:PKD domain-containing protein [Agromyces sp. SYSU K20354]|uniref:PKD domain-containing protein n=1 Tax=Agromyces cavernae TaxID=2898659 RepID=UPI001E2AC8D2|nr:PKD domain-containing protein [Agromyces cavernae]MCD2441328.1 PKD domain-containing protein [Agromyces cavernae]
MTLATAAVAGLAVFGLTPVAANAHPGHSDLPAAESFDKVPLKTDGLADPFELDVADDGRVIYIQRTGEVQILDQETLGLTTALDLDYPLSLLTQSDGLLGMTLDNDFVENGWIYLLWSDPVEFKMNLSRFTVGPDDTIDRASEKRLLDFTIWRGEGRANSHMGGSLAMGPDGNLYVATGDNTDPFEQSGFTPIDERDGRRAFDAQATSANTNDLRGKVLRITPQDDGTYTIPDGNLFGEGRPGTRAEIYGMGFRNPFRITVDPETNAVLVGDYGPDARTANPLRGPVGMVEYIRMDKPGNHGWPYCHGYNEPYVDYDFATGTSGALFDCDKPVNDSPNNTGLTKLPKAVKPQVAYGYGVSAEWPELASGGAAPMAGPVYRFDPENPSKTKFPEEFDGKWIVSEYSRNFYKVLTVDEPKNKVTHIDPFLEDQTFVSPFEAEFGPDGSLYVIDFGRGRGAGRGSTNTNAGIYRIDYTENGRRPVAQISADVESGSTPLVVNFSGEESHSPDGLALTYEWDLDGDGTVDSTDAEPTFTYENEGQFRARLTVRDPDGAFGVTTFQVTAGNTRPVVSFDAPVDGGFAELGDTLDYRVNVSDAEDGSTADGTIDCTRVTVNTQLGHDTHAHPLDNYEGCEGAIFLDPADHGPGQNVYPALGAGYEDLGAIPLAGQQLIRLQVRDKDAEFTTNSQGVQVVDRANARGGRVVTGIGNGDWMSYGPLDLRGIDRLTFGATAGSVATTIDVRVGSPTGASLGSVVVDAAAGTRVSPTLELDAAPGSNELFLVFSNANGSDSSVELDTLTFDGRGVANATAPVVSASATADAANPLSFSFDGSAIAPDGREITSLVWDFGDGTTAEGAAATHTYAQPGSYTARLIATDSQGTRDWLSVEVTETRQG